MKKYIDPIHYKNPTNFLDEIEQDKQDELTSFGKQLIAGLIDRFLGAFEIVAITVAVAFLLALIVINIAK